MSGASSVLFSVDTLGGALEMRGENTAYDLLP
jgi:hypothetical protein